MSSKLPISFFKLVLLYKTWWLVWILIQTIVLHRLNLTWCISVIDAMVSNALLAFAGFVAIIMYRFYQPGKSNRFYRLVFGLAITLLVWFKTQLILEYIFADNSEYLYFLDKSMPVRFIFSFLMISFITLFYWLWDSMSTQKEAEKRKNENDDLIKEAELSKLKQQLQPHFLFNSLNSISALIISKPTEARKMVQQLSDFLRGTLKKDDELVKLSEELEHLKLYLDIEKVRFGHRLNIEFNIVENTLEISLPSLLLQPIVENAIKFGLYDVIGDVTISISAKKINDLLEIEIKNPFDPETHNSSKGVGFGLSSIQRRLYLLYARNDLLVTSKGIYTFSTLLKIPIKK